MAFHKRWRWLGAFGPDVMLCAARVRVGLVPVGWWAVWDGRELQQGRGVTARHGVTVRRDGVFAVGPPKLLLDFQPGRAIEARTGRAWTRKTAGRVVGLAGSTAVDAPGLLDESAGRHPRHTAWLWSAGAGVTESGAAVMWNLVDGMHPGENTVWMDGEPHAVAPPRFDGLRGVAGLRFTAQATRARREDYLVIASDYEQPFGTFAGELPVAGRLREAYGVMERHEARW